MPLGLPPKGLNARGRWTFVLVFQLPERPVIIAKLHPPCGRISDPRAWTFTPLLQRSIQPDITGEKPSRDAPRRALR